MCYDNFSHHMGMVVFSESLEPFAESSPGSVHGDPEDHQEAWTCVRRSKNKSQSSPQGESGGSLLSRRQNSLVVDEGVHEQPLVDEALPLWFLCLKISVHVIGHDDAVRLVGQLDNEAVVIANHPFTRHAAWRCEHQNLLLLQVSQDVLICDPDIKSEIVSFCR